MQTWQPQRHRSAPTTDGAKLECNENSVVGVVIPAYKVASAIGDVIRAVPVFVNIIIIVDDACPQASGAVAAQVGDPRVVVLNHPQNRGVGAAFKTGALKAVEFGCTIIVKVDGDGQMDPAAIPALLYPVIDGRVACAKANRLLYAGGWRQIPSARRLGILALSFLTKLASGHWRSSDPTNGFFAIRSDVFTSLDARRISDRFFFEISLVVELGAQGYAVADLPMRPSYENTESSLSPLHALVTFPGLLLLYGLRRMFLRHVWFDFTPTALLGISGSILIAWSITFGTYHWRLSAHTGVAATAGTVMLAALPFLLGTNLLVSGFVLEASKDFNHRVSPWL